ncbi:MAG: hypothetical protein JXA22_06365 [Candidatus Thermoplasmatota archaeon]|nr:hypothetical protein [Candidatus Thermoplasmatota archaeon]
MTDPEGRLAVLSLTLLLLASSLLVLSGTDNEMSASPDQPSRATKHFLGETFTMNLDWKPEDLWLVVFVQNLDQYPGPDINNNDRLYNYMEVANSYMFPVDSNQYSSGTTRRPLVELFTATDCFYCPSSEESLDTVMQERGENEFSLIEYHRALQPGNDPYETGASGKRFDNYNVTATPTVIFDGVQGRAGGDSSVNSPMLVSAYGNAIDRLSVYDPYVIIQGSASVSEDQMSFNVSFEVIDALPRGNWVLYAVVVEDLQNDDRGATLRHTHRKTFSRLFDTLQADHPMVILDQESTYSGIDVNKVKGDLDLYFTASDPQDGTLLDIDLEYAIPGRQWEPLVNDIPNTGKYTLDTTTVKDSKYWFRIVAEDTDGNRVISGNYYKLTVNNPDLPVIELVTNLGGASLSGLVDVKWNSSDDEDPINDLLVNVSISPDLGITWEIMTYNQITGSDFVPNTGLFKLNTLLFTDLPTYMLKVQLKDQDDMVTEVVTEVFEIYNNEPPEAWIVSPVTDQVVTGTLEVGWKIKDQEDQAWGMISSMMGNFSVKITGGDLWKTIFHDNLDPAMKNKTFDTSDLLGDGEYILRFTVTDSRGLSSYTERRFRVYDPDTPEFISPIEGPSDADDFREDIFTLTWDVKDADADDSLTFRIESTPAKEDNWTLIVEGITETSYDLDLRTFDEGRYKLRVTAIDDSPQKLSGQLEYGPFYYNAPDAPEVNWLYPEKGFNGTIDDETGIANLTKVFNIDLLWSGSDPDGDNLTFAIYMKSVGSSEWSLLGSDITEKTFIWNVTSLEDGSYMLRIVAMDSSSRHLTTEALLGPFTIDLPWYPPETDDDDADDDDQDPGTGADMNIGLMVGIAVGSIIIVVILVILVLLVLNKTTGKKVDRTPVIPTENDVDLTIPDFDRPYARPPQTYSGQTVSQGPYTGIQQRPPEPTPAPLRTSQVSDQPLRGQVSWESGEEEAADEDAAVASEGQPAQITKQHEVAPLGLGPPPELP